MKDEKLLHEFTTLAVFSDFESTLNPSFHKAKLRLMAINSVAHNGVKFTHNGTMKALPTLKNAPLVTQYDNNSNNLKSHEFETDGNALTYGIGVVAESCQQWIEEVEVDGEVKEYLCSEVLMWKRQKREYDFIRKHKELNVSMEVMMNKPKKNKDGSIEVDDFYFTAVTVLGIGVNPAFGEANLVFSKDSDQYQQMIFELNEFENGGTNMPNEGQSQVQGDNTQTSATVDNTQTTTTVTESNNVNEQNTDNVVNENTNSQTQVDTTKPNEGEKVDPTQTEDTKSEPETDYKVKYEQLEAELSRTIVDLQKERDSLASQLQQAQEEAKNQLVTLQQELEDLKQYKNKIEKDKLDVERKAILEQFTDLQDTEEYNEIIKNLDEIAPNVLEDKLYIVAGRIARQNRKTQKQAPKTKLTITTPTQENTVDTSNPFAKFFM